METQPGTVTADTLSIPQRITAHQRMKNGGKELFGVNLNLGQTSRSRLQQPIFYTGSSLSKKSFQLTGTITG